MRRKVGELGQSADLFLLSWVNSVGVSGLRFCLAGSAAAPWSLGCARGASRDWSAGAVQCGARGARKMTSEQFYRCCSNFHLVVFADY